MIEYIPGTVLPYRADIVSAFSGISPLVEAAGGLSLSQVCAITGLEGSTIQNWVKRGWVPKPQGKKYDAAHLPRILLISALRENIQIEQLVILIESVTHPETHGISEAALYDALCKAVRGLDSRETEFGAELHRRLPLLARALAGSEGRVRQGIERTLTAMTYWYLAGALRRRASEIIQDIW